jgi:hypothetical protein
MLTSRANTTGEHKVKLLRLTHIVSRVRICDLVLLAKLAELRTRVVIQLKYTRESQKHRNQKV